MTDFIVEPGGFKRLVKFHCASIDVPDGRMDRVSTTCSGLRHFLMARLAKRRPRRGAQDRNRAGHPVEVLGLQCGKRIAASRAYLAEGLDSSETGVGGKRSVMPGDRYDEAAPRSEDPRAGF